MPCRALGDNLVWVEAGSRNIAGVRTGTHGTTSLTIDDAEAIRREVPLIKSISPQVDGNIHLVHGNRNWTTRFRGETPEYLAIKKWEVADGAPFTDEDVQESASKILIGQTVARAALRHGEPRWRSRPCFRAAIRGRRGARAQGTVSRRAGSGRLDPACPTRPPKRSCGARAFSGSTTSCARRSRRRR